MRAENPQYDGVRLTSMTFAPLFEAGPVVLTHTVAAVAATGLGAAQLLLPQGTRVHRLMGWAWVLLIAVVAVGSFGIQTIRQVGPFSAIHLLSVFTIVMLVLAIVHVRAGRTKAHKWTMIGLFFGALVIAGLFTLVPGRVMHRVVFGV